MWTTSQLAEATGLTPQHITRLIRKGKIKAERIPVAWIIPDEEAERFIAERQKGDESESQEAAD